MAIVTIPFDGNPLSFAVPDRNLVEVLSPKPSTPLERSGAGHQSGA